MLTHTLHKPLPMNSRVIIPSGYINDKEFHGTVVGISFLHIIFSYIVLLDNPVDTEYGEQRAVVVQGSALEGEDGSNWRLNSAA